MARIRSVHPGLFTDEHFVECSPISQVFLIGIWTECDDHGVFEWKPKSLKMRLMSAYNYDALAHLEELVANHMVRQIVVDGKAYGLVRNFCIWQRPKRPTFRYPLPEEWRTYVGLKADGHPFDPAEAHPAPPPVPPISPIKGEEETKTRYGKTYDQAGKRVLKPRTPPVPEASPTSGGIAPQRERRGEEGSGREEESHIEKPVVVVLAPEPASSKHDDNDEADEYLLEGAKEPIKLANVPVPVAPVVDVPVPGMPFALPEDWTPNEHDENVAKSFGMSVEVIQQQVLEFHAYNASRGTLSPNWSATWYRFCSAWKVRNAASPRMVPPRVETSTPYRPTPDEWHKAVETWKGNQSLWSHKTFGPEPGMGGCRCPAVILQAHGIDAKTGMPLRAPTVKP